MKTILLFLFLLSCTDNNYNINYPRPSFSHLPAYQVDVAKIEIIENQPEDELLFPNNEIIIALKNWAKERINIVGHTRKLQFIINEVDVTKTTSKKQHHGIEAPFYKELTEHYNVNVGVEIVVETTEGDFETANIKIILNRKLSLPEDISSIEREKALYQLVKNILEDFNKDFELNAMQYLGAYIF